MKLLTGASGAIGRSIVGQCELMLTPTHSELDLLNFDDTRKYLKHTKPELIIHCASNDDEICLEDNLRMFINLADSVIPMVIFSTGREVEDRPGKTGQYILSKYIAKEFAMHKYDHISVVRLWGCFGKYEKDTRFFADNIARIKRDEPIVVKTNKLFSYVYVNDLIKILRDIRGKQSFQVVAYTKTLLRYAEILKEVSGSEYEIAVESSDFANSYVGRNNLVNFEYTPLKKAIKEMWDDLYSNTITC